MVQYAQDKNQPHDRVLNPTRFNSKLSAAKRERPCFNMLYIVGGVEWSGVEWSGVVE